MELNLELITDKGSNSSERVEWILNCKKIPFKKPTPSIFPKALWDRAKVREICEIVNATIRPIQNSKVAGFFIPGITKTEIRPYRARWIGENLKRLEPLLFRGSQFAYGKTFSAADVFVAPIFRKGLDLGLKSNDFPAYLNHLKHCYSVEEVRKACPFDLKSMIE